MGGAVLGSILGSKNEVKKVTFLVDFWGPRWIGSCVFDVELLLLFWLFANLAFFGVGWLAGWLFFLYLFLNRLVVNRIKMN